MKTARPKVLLLDLGNVTVRLRFSDFFERVAAVCRPLRDPLELQRMFRDPAYGHGDYELGRMDGPAWHTLLQTKVGLTLDYGAWLRLWNDNFEPNVAMERLIEALRGQVRIWALSNTNAEHLSHLKSAYPILGAFEGITASCEAGAQKPAPAIYEAALRSLGVAGADVLYLDDVEDYVQCARALGIQGFHYTFNDEALRQTLTARGFSLPKA